MAKPSTVGVLMSLFALASCQSKKPTEITEEVVSDRKTFEGKAFWGIEGVEIVLCDHTRTNCKFPQPDEQLRVCALSFSGAGYDSLRAHRYERDEYGTPAGEVWLEGIGVQEYGARGYGHVGAYPCEVRIDRVIYLDRGPPWFFEPPPPDQ
tara:strand:- start:194 stop:646 length:453 start_codon:yes stop_codon:yes gene_type:complete